VAGAERDSTADESPSEAAGPAIEAEPADTSNDETAVESAKAQASPSTAEVAERSEPGMDAAGEAAPVAGEPSDAPAEPAQGGEDGAVAADGPAPAGASAEFEEPKPFLLWRPARFDRGPRRQHQRAHGKGRPQDGANADASHRQEGDRGPRRFDRKGKPPRFDGGGGQDRQGQGKRPQDAHRTGKPPFQQKPREERPARFDPDSPFAKLAALRDQLKK
jgi:ATP-dependent RNA helicase SUPV3L1/SUV3